MRFARAAPTRRGELRSRRLQPERPFLSAIAMQAAVVAGFATLQFRAFASGER
jgi:hypothetical protein